MKYLIKFIICNACVALLVLQPNCVNQKLNDSQLNMKQNTVHNSPQSAQGKVFTVAHFANKSKTEMHISAELIVLNNHARPKKKRPSYLYC